MAEHTKTTRMELANRTSNGLEITLVWVHGDGEDRTVVTVHDSREGSSFEIPAEPNLALDVYYHPFAYWDSGQVGDESQLAGAAR